MSDPASRGARTFDDSRPPLDPRDEARMTLIEHLGELRSRIIKVGVTFFVLAMLSWFFRLRILEWMLEPSGLEKLQVLSPTEQLMTHVKLCLYAGFMLSVPVIVYQAWAFVAPAVGKGGRVFAHVLVALSSTLFLAGAAFGYYVVLRVGLPLLIEWDPEHFDPNITSAYYLPFVTRSLLAFGLVFELPAVAYVGAKLGLLDAPILRRHRRHAVVVNVILAAALTPGQDVVTMALMAVPMILLHEVSIVIVRHVRSSPSRARERTAGQG